MIPLPLSAGLLAKLRARRDASGGDEIERAHDAFLIYVGITAYAIYLTSSGEILSQDGIDGTTKNLTIENDVISSLVVGANTTGITELLELVPPRPAGAVECPLCAGDRYWYGHKTVICFLCLGRAWATPAMIDAFGPIPPATAGR